MEERDLSGRIDRATFEELISGELQRIEQVMVDCLKASEWKPEDIYSVEVVGGSSRIPSVKAAIENVFGKTPQTTLNADEAVSRGCALQCAILSPTFRVREFSVTDLQVCTYLSRSKCERFEFDSEIRIESEFQFKLNFMHQIREK